MNETLHVHNDGVLTYIGNLPKTILLAGAISIVFFSLSLIISPKIDPREPPVVWPKVPLIGHVIGMIFGGFKYYRQPAEKSSAPIITLPILNGRMYLATGKDIISQIARNSKSLSFDPFVAPMAAKVTGGNEKMVAVVKKNLSGEEGSDGYYINIKRRMKTLLAPGENLTNMEKSVYNFMSQELQKIHNMPQGKTVGLFDQMRHFFNAGTFNTLYGPSYPYENVPGYPEDVIAFENGLNGLLLDTMPSVIARKAYLARERMVVCLTEYLRNGLPDDANPVIRARYEEGIRAGLTHAEIARFEVVLVFAVVENSGPSAFWIILYIWAIPGLADELRTDLLAVLKSSHPEHKSSEPLPYSFLTSVSKRVPLLKSVFDEMLRMHGNNCSVRYALSDTVLQGHERDYLVKKDSVVVIPNTVLHRKPESFIEPTTFEPRRFMSEVSKSADYRPWGGGGTICPGRHFATSETMAVAAMMIIGFDIVCVDERGNERDWWIPEDYQHSQAAGVFPPTKDVRIKMVPRKGWNLGINAEF